MEQILKNKVKINKKLIFSIIFNLIVVILEIYSISVSARNKGWGLFRFYTDNSNILALISCFITLLFQLILLFKTNYNIPVWIGYLKYIATCCMSLTLFIVSFVLAPACGLNGIIIMFTYNSMLYHHFICPVLVLISFLFFDKFNLLFKSNFFALIPTCLYGIVILILNILKIVKGPYPFLFVYEFPWFVIMLFLIAVMGIAFLISWIIWLFNKKLKK